MQDYEREQQTRNGKWLKQRQRHAVIAVTSDRTDGLRHRYRPASSVPRCWLCRRAMVAIVPGRPATSGKATCGKRHIQRDRRIPYSTGCRGGEDTRGLFCYAVRARHSPIPRSCRHWVSRLLSDRASNSAGFRSVFKTITSAPKSPPK
jgi:hypothetical protein